MLEKSQTELGKVGVWAFVLKSIEIRPEELPYELTHGCFIDKASAAQISHTKTNLTNILGGFSHYGCQEVYESDVVFKKAEKRGHHHIFTELSESDWRYYVVTSPDDRLNIINLHLASNISAIHLEFGALAFEKTGGIHWQPSVIHEHFTLRSMSLVKKVSKESLDDLSQIYRLFMSRTNGINGKNAPYPEILQAMGMFDELRFLSKDSVFQVLGLFAIIEMLITHNPKGVGAALTQQIKAKMPLLSRRFDPPLDFSTLLSCKSEEAIWGQLYDYRSCLAHGDSVDFSKNMKLLKDANTAIDFLKEAVKALLRHYLKEPDLCRDLKKC